jgi:hypothetical protein
VSASQLAAERAESRIVGDGPEEGMGVQQDPHQGCSNSSWISGLAASIESGT